LWRGGFVGQRQSKCHGSGVVGLAEMHSLAVGGLVISVNNSTRSKNLFRVIPHLTQLRGEDNKWRYVSGSTQIKRAKFLLTYVAKETTVDATLSTPKASKFYTTTRVHISHLRHDIVTLPCFGMKEETKQLANYISSKQYMYENLTSAAPSLPLFPHSKLQAKPGARLNLLPLLGTRSRDSIEHSIRIILLPDLEESLIVVAPEGLLPVGLVRVGLSPH
jgi:hypothetical protein